MSIPEIYLVEPYNAYAPKGRKKHWHEVVEEQALMQRIMAEQIALQEAQSKTLPPNSPNIANPTVGNMNAGAGGTPVWDYWNPSGDVLGFTASPTNGAGPLTVVFINRTTSPELDTYVWNFGDGQTSTDINPTHVYQTGSAAGYTVELTASHALGSPMTTSSVGYISASIPKVTALFSYFTSSGPGPITATFTNGSTNTSQTPSSIYLWTFDDTTSSSLYAPPVHSYANTGSFTASVQITGSYALASIYTQSFYVPAPTVTAAFTFITESNAAASSASFTNTSTCVTSSGTLVYLWNMGSGSLTYSTQNPPGTINYINAGPYTASLQVTESNYGVASIVTHAWRLS